jgi:hypothetical protein
VAAPLVARPISRLRQIAGQWRGFPDAQRSWIGPAIALGRQLAAEHRYDVVWSTSPPESVHYVGAALAAHGVRWVADFRDQWSEYLLARWDPLSRRIIDGITRRTLAGAAAITAATDGVAGSIARATDRPVTCVRNGFDPVTLSAMPVPRRLGYFGRIDPLMQRPDRLWPALRRLEETGRPWTVEIFSSPGGGGGASVEVPADLMARVAVRSPLPHADALRRMQEEAALLVLGWETRRGETAVAAKLYEYVGAARPVLVIAPPDYEARRLVERTRTGVGAWTTDEIVAALAAFETFTPDPAGRASLSRADAARDVLAVLERAAR